MPTALGSLRRLVMTPSMSSVSFGGRGFPVTASGATERLEAIPQTVVCGFEWGIDARSLWEVERRLNMVDPELRGFAYEGVAMAFTVLDAISPGRGHRTRDLLLGSGQPHIFLAYIGIGFAMARLPRPLWKKVMPDLTGSAFYPTMTWLAVDGYGFDRAYFDTKNWVDQQKAPPSYPWLGSSAYFLRAVDQGIGRALWFIHAAQASGIAAAVGRFASHRQADLWSGVGLAAAFAGGATADGMAALRVAAGEYGGDLAQGAVFAATARAFSEVVPEHTEVTVMALAGLSVTAATTLGVESAVETSDSPAVPAYELWRQKIRDHFSSVSG
ncbi:MAG TPA: DUF1702 family protein [Streptosporangiaceae bacterium]|nr:DUF1702 family protein [Streptosporangiaceae bacterium]